MKPLSALFIAVFLSLTLSACVKVLSKRTDQQAWLEFDQEVRLTRAPASEEASTLQAVSLQEALNQIEVRKILIKCGALASPEVCYSSALTLQFDEIFRQIQVLHPELMNSDYRKAQNEFLARRSYRNVSDEVKRFHQSMLSGIDLKAREHAEELFHNCENERDLKIPIEHFGILGSVNFIMPKAVYACLTRNWNSDQDQLLAETSDRLGLTILSAESKQWIKAHQIGTIYEEEINELGQKKAREEYDRFQIEKDDCLKDFNSKLSEEALLKQWSRTLKERYPYSPVEQWIIAYRKDHR